MNSRLKYFLPVFIFLAIQEAHAQSLDRPSDDSYLKNQAEFHATENSRGQDKKGIRLLGVGTTFASVGVSLTEYSTERIRIWGEVGSFFGKELPLFLDEKDDAWKYNSVKYTQDFKAILGGTFVYSIDQAKEWFIQVSPYLAYEKARYKVTSYEKLCSFVCGYDPNSGVSNEYVSNFLSVGIRVGVEKQVIINNHSAEVGLSIDKKLLSSEPKRYHSDLNGNRFPIEYTDGFFVFETKFMF